MKKKRKICVVVTARPSYSRIKTALQAIANHDELELQIVVAASALLDRYGNAASIMESDGLKIAARAHTLLEGENLPAMAKTAGIGIIELSSIFTNLQPDFVVSIADRYETISTAISAAYMNIPLVHIQGGEVTGSIDEKVRHAVSKLADIHLVSNLAARDRLIRMGEEAPSIHITGCPSIDLARQVLESSRTSKFNPFDRYGGVGPTLNLSDGYIVVMQHPVTTQNIDAGYQIDATLEAIRNVDFPVLFFWPNPDAGADVTSKKIRTFREEHNPKNIHFFRNMEPLDFLALLVNSRCIVGNSSVGIRECAFLGVPAVNVGDRQSGRDRGKNVIDLPHDSSMILSAIKSILNTDTSLRHSDAVYGDGYAGIRIAEVLACVEPLISKKLTY